MIGPDKITKNAFWKEVSDAWNNHQSIQDKSQYNRRNIFKNDEIKICNHLVIWLTKTCKMKLEMFLFFITLKMSTILKLIFLITEA